MSRVAAALFAVIALTVLAGDVAAAGATPPTPPAAPTTPGVPATTLPGAAVPTSTVAAVVPPAGTRGGSAEGGVAKPTQETWSPRRIATTTLLVVIALAAAGYVYGKARSAPPRHPDLVRQPDDEMAG
jgi:hypothetical protein